MLKSFVFLLHRICSYALSADIESLSNQIIGKMSLEVVAKVVGADPYSDVAVLQATFGVAVVGLR